MSGLTGRYECKIDAKGRLKLPAGLLRQLPEGSSRKFFINKGLDNYIDLYTESNWDKITQKLEQLNRLNSKHRKFLRRFYSHAISTEMDTSDRILISKTLGELVGIQDDVIIICYGTSIEIWAKETFDRDNDDTEDFSEMADDIFGNTNPFE